MFPVGAGGGGGAGGVGAGGFGTGAGPGTGPATAVDSASEPPPPHAAIQGLNPREASTPAIMRRRVPSTVFGPASPDSEQGAGQGVGLRVFFMEMGQSECEKGRLGIGAQ